MRTLIVQSLSVGLAAIAIGCSSGGSGPSGPAPGPTLSINDPTANEPGVAIFVISLSQTLNKPVTFEYMTASPSSGAVASPNSDYVTVPRDTGTIAIGETRLQIPVTVLADNAKLESDETFNLVLSNITNARFADSVGTATIIEATTTISDGNRPLLPDAGTTSNCLSVTPLAGMYALRNTRHGRIVTTGSGPHGDCTVPSYAVSTLSNDHSGNTGCGQRRRLEYVNN